MDTPGRPEKIKIDLPADVTMTEAPAGATLNQMLIDGEIDGFVGPRAPRCFDERHPQVGRLFRDTVAEAEDYYRKTSTFPIMHVLGIRRSLADEHPWLPGALLKAFIHAKELAEKALSDTSATKVTMPFVEDNLARTRRLMGDDPWSYGLARNAKVLETFLRYHVEQGLSPRKVEVGELFHPATIEAYSL
jgi:4,5-dihydroxyphthalate decarboxylase